MASGIFAVLDDIATLMDDMALMSKVAAKKTAGILGDDLAVNAEKASGFVAQREIPVLWAITKGSFLNKLIILPIAFLLSAFLPWAVILLLLLGGIYLSYEGAEKIYEWILPHKHVEEQILKTELSEEDILSLEKERVKSAIITDFILSIEIVIIALGTVVNEPILEQIIVVTIIAVAATIGVYGIVALIVRMDDIGYKILKGSGQRNKLNRSIGSFLVRALPKVIKSLSVIGTIALITVSGGIFVHNIGFMHHFLPNLPSIIPEILIGLIAGFIGVGAVKFFKFIRDKLKDNKPV